jgi:hypothetical protein
MVLLQFSVPSTLWTFLGVCSCFVPIFNRLIILCSMKFSVALLLSSVLSLALLHADSKTKGTVIEFLLLIYMVHVYSACSQADRGEPFKNPGSFQIVCLCLLPSFLESFWLTLRQIPFCRYQRHVWPSLGGQYCCLMWACKCLQRFVF